MSTPQSIREYRLSKASGTAFSHLTLGTAQVPTLKSNEVLLKVHAVSLQFRDLMVASGKYAGLKENVVPGSDMAGTIAATGDGVQDWEAGEKVCANFALDHIDGDTNPKINQTCLGAPIDGVLREYFVVPVHSLVRFPKHFTFEEASTLPCAGLTAWNALYGPKPLKAGDTVLVIGTGGVSIFALQFAVAAGATIIALSSSNEKLAKAKALGAQHLINYRDVPAWDEEVLKLTNGRGVDHVIEVGGAGTLSKSVNAVRMAGYVHVIGVIAGAADVNHIPGLLVAKACILRGVRIGSVRQFNEMNRAIEVNKIKPVIDKVFSFEETKQAYEHLQSQKHVGKVVIKVSKD